MAYVGNAKTPLILTTNVRDDLIPGYNQGTTTGAFDKKQFLLSQEVPGGDEKNITVIRRKYIIDSLISFDSLSPRAQVQLYTGGGYLDITVTDEELAAALSVVQEKSANYEGDLLTITYLEENLPPVKSITKKVDYVTYNGTEISIGLKLSSGDPVIPSNVTLANISRSFYAPWEILDAKSEYSIVDLPVSDSKFNRIVQLKEAPQKDDIVYVLHRGDATYNFVPSPGSVGEEQLSDSLKNFKCDRFAGDGVADTFTLSQRVADPKAVLVTVDGVVKDNEGLTQNDAPEYEIIEVEGASVPNIKFAVVPSNGSKIRVLHLGVVSKDIRAAFAPGQETTIIPDNYITRGKLTDNCIGTSNLIDGSVTLSKLVANSVGTSNLINGSVTLSKLAANSVGTSNIVDASVTLSKLAANSVGTSNIVDASVTGAKIQLINNQPIQGVVSSTVTDVLGIENLNTILTGRSSIQIRLADSSNKTLSFTSASLATSDSGVTSLGSSANKFKDLHLSGDASVGGNISLPTAGATVDGVDISALKAEFDALKQKVSLLVPIGSIVLWTKTSLPDDNWVVCDGSAVDRNTYSQLFQVIGTAYGAGDGISTFNLPDLKRRVPVGKAAADSFASSDNLSEANRSLSHSHVAPEHTHTVSDHIHVVPGHKHTVVAATGSIAITGSNSGTHTTSLNHTHLLANNTAGTTGNPINTTDLLAKTLDHKHSISHLHINQSTGEKSVDHTHSGTVVHQHRVKFTETNYTVVSNCNATNKDFITIPIRTVVNPSNSTSLGVETIDTGSTPPSLSINSSAATTPNPTSHFHTITITDATEPFSGLSLTTNSTASLKTSNDLLHRHALPDITFTGTVGGGAHTHAFGDFTGAIGDPSAPEGNENRNTQPAGAGSTGAPAYTSTSSTSSVTIPHIVLNYIIKAKDS